MPVSNVGGDSVSWIPVMRDLILTMVDITTSHGVVGLWGVLINLFLGGGFFYTSEKYIVLVCLVRSM